MLHSAVLTVGPRVRECLSRVAKELSRYYYRSGQSVPVDEVKKSLSHSSSTTNGLHVSVRACLPVTIFSCMVGSPSGMIPQHIERRTADEELVVHTLRQWAS